MIDGKFDRVLKIWDKVFLGRGGGGIRRGIPFLNSNFHGTVHTTAFVLPFTPHTVFFFTYNIIPISVIYFRSVERMTDDQRAVRRRSFRMWELNIGNRT